VWETLLRIPRGGIVSYDTIAAQIGQPTAARAVGNAVSRNIVGYLIPCHRVIRASGVIGNYRWGTTRKQAILAWESVNNSVEKQAAKFINCYPVFHYRYILFHRLIKMVDNNYNARPHCVKTISSCHKIRRIRPAGF